MRTLGFLETNDDRMIEGLAQPVRYALAQNTRCGYPRNTTLALAGHDEDEPRAFDLRLRQEVPQREESFLPAHAVEVDRGIGRGAAARKLLPKPPFKRRQRGRGRRRGIKGGGVLAFDRRRGPFIVGFYARGTELHVRVVLRLRRRRQTASRPARDALRHVQPKLDLFRAQPPEPGLAGR
jgi:hypothetical protein